MFILLHFLCLLVLNLNCLICMCVISNVLNYCVIFRINSYFLLKIYSWPLPGSVLELFWLLFLCRFFLYIFLVAIAILVIFGVHQLLTQFGVSELSCYFCVYANQVTFRLLIQNIFIFEKKLIILYETIL